MSARGQAPSRNRQGQTAKFVTGFPGVKIEANEGIDALGVALRGLCITDRGGRLAGLSKNRVKAALDVGLSVLVDPRSRDPARAERPPGAADPADRDKARHADDGNNDWNRPDKSPDGSTRLTGSPSA